MQRETARKSRLRKKAYVQQLESSNGGTDEDPHYKFFLDHVKARGTCYVSEIPEQNICIEYPDVALTVASEAQNNVGDCSEKGRLSLRRFSRFRLAAVVLLGALVGGSEF
ncbi:uncharacterized protein LOC130939141 [Arachis stenosperma]|uniref:uncharacterized protein LOC130939141 n=1 Tax=Arachis stenosperma TaxID=217475 RepID=UPI0025AD775C|nr:uncharacterized protein LOC130939141 [Arachis stenosperma]